MAASINPHYHGLVDMGRYVGLRKSIFVESHSLMPGITTAAAGAFLRPCTNAEQAWGAWLNDGMEMGSAGLSYAF